MTLSFMLGAAATAVFALPAIEDDPALPNGLRAMNEVEDADTDAAVRSGNWPAAVSPAYAAKDRDCAHRAAWVSLASTASAGPVSVRLGSGTYFSQTIAVTAAPVRIALPYPAPYETGRGEIKVLVEGAGAIVALRPPLVVSSTPDGGQLVPVVWRPVKQCASDHG